MQELFASLSNAIEGQTAVAFGAVFLWGVLSVLLSPCHLGSIPLVVGYIGEQGKISTKRAFVISTVFSLGILLSIAVIAMITGALGRMKGDVGAWGNYAVAGVFFLFGLVLLGVISLPWSGVGEVKVKRKDLLGALVLGLIFGICLGPCTFAFMAPVLAVATFKSTFGASLLLLYGLGHCGVIVFAGTFGKAVQGFTKWNENSRVTFVVRRICGVAIICFGLYLIFTAR